MLHGCYLLYWEVVNTIFKPRVKATNIGGVKTKTLPLKCWIIVFSVFLVHCELGMDPIPEENLYPDRVYVKKGIYLKLEGIQDSYALQDTISGKMILVNEHNSKGLDIHVGGLPWGNFLITNQIGILQYFYPMIKTLESYDIILLPGDTLNVSIRWDLETNAIDLIPYGLGVYAGNYKFSGHFEGNELLDDKELVKWIEITEEGDPISPIAFRHYEAEDSFKISFTVRNRISTIQVFDLKDDYPFLYFLVSSSGLDTVMHTRFDEVPGYGEQLILDSKSETTIYCFEISEDDPELAELSGLYYVTFLIRCEEREIKASRRIGYF